MARHMIHVNETLIVASKSIKGIEQQHLDFITKQSYGECRWNRTQNRFRFQLDLLQSLLSRSESNRARLQNEITLAFNAEAQRDSKVQVRIGQEARRETAAMKAIAIVTMTFLPATFVSLGGLGQEEQ
ncbi:MAG: hypothetical protein LQ342_007541 [Letrouitia transgressa]|nr:MAG: hypothetical protein LQ342_007541 [Letrouitia transgressa]